MELFDVAMMLRPLELLLMVFILLGIVVWAYRPSRRSEHEKSALIPLRDDHEI